MKAKIQDAVKTAMKERNKVKVETLRSILTAMQYEEMQKKVDTLPEAECLAVLQRELKKRREEVEFATQAKREDLLEKLKMEICAIEEFLPKQLSAEEIERAIMDLKSTSANASVGQIMKGLQERFGGQYDGRAASEIAKRLLA